jgi:hypothetical protein
MSKRQRRTKAQILQLQTQIYDVLEADYPQSVRHVFYRMTDPRLGRRVMCKRTSVRAWLERRESEQVAS